MDDRIRRLELRDFLIAARSRLGPHDVGLPSTGRRRVPGLRREEVAELAGVTPVWYRWLESGREIRVSEQFVVRLSAALRLCPRDEITLYHLAFAGLYRADRSLR
jgi:transcriptional regulator with XRE-family HTH domain